MGKPKAQPHRLGNPKTPNPTKEMSWCFSKHIYVYCNVEALFDGRYYKTGSRYSIVIRRGNDIRETEYKYDKNNITDAIFDTYRQIYKMNYGKGEE
jgi:hypothetical protein